MKIAEVVAPDSSENLRRAMQLGYTIKAFHGTAPGWRSPTTPDIHSFNTNGSPSQRVAGAYFSRTPAHANKYASHGGGDHPEMTGAGAVYPVMLRILHPAGRKELDELGYRLNGVQMRDELIRRGFDGVDDPFMDEIVVFHPNQIRSLFANFDPRKANSPNIAEDIEPGNLQQDLEPGVIEKPAAQKPKDNDLKPISRGS